MQQVSHGGREMDKREGHGREACLESLEEVEGGESDGGVESCPMEGVRNEVVQSRVVDGGSGTRWRGIGADKEV